MDTVTWNEVECGEYSADLPLWEELADLTEAPVMELGCGAGRVVLHLGKRGRSLVVGVDRDPQMVSTVWEKTHGQVDGDAEVADVRDFDLLAKFGLVLAPMQLIQLLADRRERLACLSCVAAHLLPGGRAAFAIVEELPGIPPGEAAPALPDVRQVEGWVYSSLPLEPLTEGDSIRLRRLRQTVDPAGELSEEMNEIRLATLSAATLEAEGEEVGLRALERRQIPSTEAHVGSTVVLFEKES